MIDTIKSESIFEQFERAKKSPFYSEELCRVIVTKDSVESLPILRVSIQELNAAKTGFFYNPINIYPKGVVLAEGEEGHDDKFRYVLCDSDGGSIKKSI